MSGPPHLACSACGRIAASSPAPLPVPMTRPESAGAATGTSQARAALRHALRVNAAAAVVKLGAFALIGAPVLAAEGLHSLADCGNELALLRGLDAAGAGPSPRYPLGRERVRFVRTFALAIVIFGAGAAGTFAEATYRLLHPSHVPNVALTLVALAVTLGLEGYSLVHAAHMARPAKGARSWRTYLRVAPDLELPVVLLEDVANVVGLTLAILGVVAASATGSLLPETVASYLVGGLIAGNALFLGIESSALLVGESAEDQVVGPIAEAVREAPGPGGPVAVSVVHLSPSELLVLVEVDPPDARGTPSVGPWFVEVTARVQEVTPLRTRTVLQFRPPPVAPLPPAPQAPSPD